MEYKIIYLNSLEALIFQRNLEKENVSIVDSRLNILSKNHVEEEQYICYKIEDDLFIKIIIKD